VGGDFKISGLPICAETVPTAPAHKAVDRAAALIILCIEASSIGACRLDRDQPRSWHTVVPWIPTTVPGAATPLWARESENFPIPEAAIALNCQPRQDPPGQDLFAEIWLRRTNLDSRTARLSQSCRSWSEVPIDGLRRTDVLEQRQATNRGKRAVNARVGANCKNLSCGVIDPDASFLRPDEKESLKKSIRNRTETIRR
jgi:hypothetical protein